MHKYDGEFPKRYFDETLEYLDMTKEYFFQLADKFRSPHLWERDGDNWKQRYTVDFEEGSQNDIEEEEARTTQLSFK